MKQFKLTFLLAMLLSMVACEVFAYDIAVKNEDGVIICYNYINENTELAVARNEPHYSDDSDYSGDFVIPETVTYMGITRKVTSIGDFAFYDCRELKSVTIPNSVTSIGDYAFHRCSSLASVTIPNGITSISNSTFYGCSSLASVTIPSSVTSIGIAAFGNCSNLTSVTIPNSVTTIKDGAFNDCI